MAQILYTYKDGVYANLTNLCNCRCTFCVRFQHEGIGNAPTLWHKVNPNWEQVKAAVDAFDFTGFKELVFCGYGEPTCALDLMLKTARYVRKIHPELKLRVNTNGLGSLENGRDIVPDLAQVLDAVSISLNAPDEADYNKVTRPTRRLPGYVGFRPGMQKEDSRHPDDRGGRASPRTNRSQPKSGRKLRHQIESEKICIKKGL